jgi:hypothetical protein
MLAPLDREYRRLLEARRPSLDYYPRSGRADVFLTATKFNLQSVMRLLISSEAKIEGWRQRLDRTIGFRVKCAFDSIDRDDKGYFNENDMVSFLRRFDISYLSKDLDLILYRFDRNRDGLVSFTEVSHFINSLSSTKNCTQSQPKHFNFI